MVSSKQSQFPIGYRWDIRTGSPRKLWRTLHDFLTDNEYEHQYEELEPKDTPIEGTAIFSGQLSGRRDRKRRRRVWLLVIGILLCVLIVFIPLGIKLIKKSGGKLRMIVRIGVEGEAYRARGAEMGAEHAAEVLDVVADARVTLEAAAGRAKEDTEYEIEKLTKDEREAEEFTGEFEELKRRLNELLPRVALPSIKPPGD